VRTGLIRTGTPMARRTETRSPTRRSPTATT
jgi:hypothetical protein